MGGRWIQEAARGGDQSKAKNLWRMQRPKGWTLHALRVLPKFQGIPIDWDMPSWQMALQGACLTPPPPKFPTPCLGITPNIKPAFTPMKPTSYSSTQSAENGLNAGFATIQTTHSSIVSNGAYKPVGDERRPSRRRSG